MPNQILPKVLSELGTYLGDPNAVDPLIYAYGINKNSNSPQRKDIVIPETEELKKLLQSYKDLLQRQISGDASFENFETLEDYNSPCVKFVTEEDKAKTIAFREAPNERVVIEDFIRRKYEHPILIVELELGGGRLFLFKSIPQTYFLRPKLSVSFKNYREDHPQKAKYIDNKEQIILDERFEMAVLLFEDNEESDVAFIWRKIRFEELYQYHEVYDQSYQQIKTTIPEVEWATIEVSDQIKRQCFHLEHFGELRDCITEIKRELLSPEENQIKKSFEKREISFEEIDGNFKINPTGKAQLKFVLKALRDQVAETCILKKGVLVSQSEEI